MAQSQGSQVQVLVDTEATFGTTPGAPNGRILYVSSSNVTGKRSLVEDPVLRANRLAFTPVQGNLDISGSLATVVDAEMFGFLLYHMLGTPVTTGAGPYVHTFKAGNALPAGMVIEHNFTDQAAGNFKHLYNGCKVNNLNLTLPQEGPATAAVDVIGKSITTSATSFDATATDLGHSSFTGFEASITEGGAAIATVTDVQLTVANNLDGGNYTIDGSGGQRNAIPEGKIAVTGSFNALFDSMALMDKATNHTTSSLVLTFSRGTGAGSAGNESVTITLPELKYEQKGPEVSGPAGVLINMAFTAFYDAAAEATSLQVVINNPVATY